jgi:hypothetical protein
MRTLYQTLVIFFLTLLLSVALYAIGTAEWSQPYIEEMVPARGGGGGGGGGQGGGGHNHFSEAPSPEYAFSGSFKTLFPMTMTIFVVIIIQKSFKQTQDTQKMRRKLKERDS